MTGGLNKSSLITKLFNSNDTILIFVRNKIASLIPNK